MAPEVPIDTQGSTTAPEAKNLAHSRWAGKELISLTFGHAVATPSAECISAAPESQVGLLKSVSNAAISSGISSLAPFTEVKKSSNTHKKRNKKKNNACQSSNQEKLSRHVHTENFKGKKASKDFVANAQPLLDWSEEPELQEPAAQTNFMSLGPNTLGGRAFPDQCNQANQETLVVRERLQSMVPVQPGAFLRPRPKFYGFQCSRTLGATGVYGCTYGHSCYYGHEGDVYTDSTHKYSHYVNRWQTGITEAEKTKLKSMMTGGENKIKARNLLQNPTFRAEPRIRASDFTTPSQQTYHHPQEFSIKTKKQKKRPQNRDGDNEHTPPHHQNSNSQPNDQTKHHQNPALQKIERIHLTEQSHCRQDFSFQKNQNSHHRQEFAFPFQNHNQIYSRRDLDFQPWQSRHQGVSFYNSVQRMDPMANDFAPFSTQFSVAQDYNFHHNLQAQPQFTCYQEYYDGDFGSQHHASDTGADDMQRSQSHISVPGDMNTKNMEQVPRIKTEDLVYNWQRSIPSALIPAGGPEFTPVDNVKPVNSFTLRPEVSAFVPEIKKQWPGLDKGQYPGHPFDSMGTLIPGVTSPGFLIWTSAGYGYYGNNGVWYPYREPTDGSDGQKDIRVNKNQDSSEKSSAGKYREV